MRRKGQHNIFVATAVAMVFLTSDAHAQLLGAPRIAFHRNGECGQNRVIEVEADLGDGAANAAYRAQFWLVVSTIFSPGNSPQSVQQYATPTIPFRAQLLVPFDVVGPVDVATTLSLRTFNARTRTGGAVLQEETTVVPDMDIGEDPMHAIYGGLRLENLEIERTIYAPGEMPAGTFILSNRSDTDLCIPSDPYFPQFHTVGVMQKWIERLGDSKDIPGIPPLIARDAAGRYAAGGSILVADPDTHWPPDFEMPQRWEMFFDTTQFPAGLYRLYIEYKKRSSDGDNVIQVGSLDFQMN